MRFEVGNEVKVISGTWLGLVGPIDTVDIDHRIHIAYDGDGERTCLAICNPSELELIKEAGE